MFLESQGPGAHLQTTTWEQNAINEVLGGMFGEMANTLGF
jgi:hypothetical protein